MPESKSSLTFPAPTLDAEPQPDPLKSFHANSPGWVELQLERFRERFFENPKNKAVYDNWVADETAKARVANEFRRLTELVESDRFALGMLKRKVELYTTCDVALSIHRAWKSGSLPLENIADTFTRVLVLKEHGPAVIKLAQAELATLEKNLESFIGENKTDLKKLGLI